MNLQKALESMKSEQLDRLVQELNLPSGIISPEPTVRGDRIIALLSWAEEKNKITELKSALNIVLNLHLDEESATHNNEINLKTYAAEDLKKRWNTLKLETQRGSVSKEVQTKLEKLLEDCINKGREISDTFARSSLQTLARDVGDAVFWATKEYPIVTIESPVYEDTPSRNLPHLLYRQNPFFTGRDSLLEKIRDKFIQQFQQGKFPIQAIVGLGGVGKTQTAVEYSYRYYDQYKAIFFVRAESYYKLCADYTEIANRLQLINNISNRDEIIFVVRKWFEENSNWLLVFDDIEEPQALESFLPIALRGHILLTSRMPILDELGVEEPVKLEPMKVEEAVDFLLKRTKRKNITSEEIEAVQELARELGYFPLALEQAGAYVYEKQTLFKDYISVYREEGLNFLNQTQPKAGTPHSSINQTWELSFQTIEKESRISAEILRFSAFLNSENIPIQLVLDAFSEFNTADSDYLFLQIQGNLLAVDIFLEPLTRFSLISRDLEFKNYSIHHLVQEVLKNRMGDELLHKWADKAVRIIDKAFPSDIQYENWFLCEQILPHAEAVVKYIFKFNYAFPEAAHLLNQVGYYLRKRAQYEQAEILLLEALGKRRDLSKSNCKESKENLVQSLINLALLYEALGQYEKAISFLDESLIIIKQIRAYETQYEAFCLNSMARICKLQGRFIEAEQISLKALQIRQKLFGDYHHEVAQSFHDLALIYLAQGRFFDAKNELERALIIRRVILSNKHPDIAHNLNDLAHVYKGMGFYENVEKLYCEALQIREEIFGEVHPDVAESLENLARLYRVQARYTDASKLYKRALDINRQRLGNHHPVFARNLDNLAYLYYLQGNFIEAEKLYQSSLAISEDIFGEDHTAVTNSLSNLALLYKFQGRYGEAESLYLKIFLINKQLVGDNHPLVAGNFNDLGRLYFAQGRYEEAEPLIKQALEINRQIHKEHPYVAANLNNLGHLYYVQGKYYKAEELLREALLQRKHLFGDEHPEVANTLNNLADLYRVQERYDDAELLYSQALRIRERLLGKDHSDYAQNLDDLGMLYVLQKRYREAESFLNQALEIRIRALGDEHPDVSRNRNNLALLCFYQHRYNEAERIFQHVLETGKHTLGEDHPDVARCLDNLGMLYAAQGRIDEAEVRFVAALETLEIKLEEDHPRTIRCRNNLKNLLSDRLDSLSDFEREVLFWLVIHRDSMSLIDLANSLRDSLHGHNLESTLQSLEQQLLIIRTDAYLKVANSSVIEYLIELLIDRISDEINVGRIELISRYPLLVTQVKEDVLEKQVKHNVFPILYKLKSKLRNNQDVKDKLISILPVISQLSENESYAAGNILNLLIYLQGKTVDNVDFSHLSIRQVDFRNTQILNSSFVASNFSESIFTDIKLGIVISIAFSPDGELLATGDANGFVRIWDVSSGQEYVSFESHHGWVWTVVFSPDGKFLATGGDDHLIKLWDMERQGSEPTAIFSQFDNEVHTDSVRSLAFSPNGHFLASGSGDWTVGLWDLRHKGLVCKFKGHKQSVRSVGFSPNGHLLASGSVDGTVKVWVVATGELLLSTEEVKSQGKVDRIRSVVFHPAGETIASAHDSGFIRFWNVETGEKSGDALKGHKSWVCTLSFSHNGQWLASSGEDGSVNLWSFKTRQCMKSLKGHQSWIRSVRFSPDDRLLASGSVDFSVRLWEIPNGRCTKVIQGYANWVWATTYSPNGKLIASGHGDYKVRLWDVKTYREAYVLSGHKDWVRSVAFSSDNQFLASGSGDRTVIIWDVATGKLLNTLKEHTSWVRAVVFNPTDSNVLASSSDDTTIKLWDIRTGKCLNTLEGHTDPVRSIAFHPNGCMLASGSGDGTVRLWDISLGKCINDEKLPIMLHRHDGSEASEWVWAVAFSPNGQVLASGGGDKVTRLWKIDAERQEFLPSHILYDEAPVRALAFSADGKVLAVGGVDRRIRLWDVETGEERNVLEGHTDVIRAIAFSPVSEDLNLVSSSQDETIRFWNVKESKSAETGILKVPGPYAGMDITDATGLDSYRESLIALGALDRTFK